MRPHRDGQASSSPPWPGRPTHYCAAAVRVTAGWCRLEYGGRLWAGLLVGLLSGRSAGFAVRTGAILTLSGNWSRRPSWRRPLAARPASMELVTHNWRRWRRQLPIPHAGGRAGEGFTLRTLPLSRHDAPGRSSYRCRHDRVPGSPESAAADRAGTPTRGQRRRDRGSAAPADDPAPPGRPAAVPAHRPAHPGQLCPRLLPRGRWAAFLVTPNTLLRWRGGPPLRTTATAGSIISRPSSRRKRVVDQPSKTAGHRAAGRRSARSRCTVPARPGRQCRQD